MSSPKLTPLSARKTHWVPLYLALMLAVIVAALAALLLGSTSVGLNDVLALITGSEIKESARSILMNVRLPRVLAALLAGAALAVSGALIQAVLDNPLASPNIIGINAGAGLFVLIASSLAPTLYWLIPPAAFVGALITALIIFGISLGTNTSQLTVILAGVAITAVFGAGMNTILIVNPDAYVNASGFLVGGLAGVKLSTLRWPAVYVALGLVLALASSGKLNIMALGDQTAHALGMRVGLTRMALLGVAALLAGAAVSFAGLLGFVGLVVPHIVRFIVGHDNKHVVPLSALVGSVFVVLCDLVARTLFAPYELPVGILMAFLGGPFFIYLILRNKRAGER